jgi:hypothetical protein
MAPKPWQVARGLLAIVLMLGFYALAISVALGLLTVAYLQVVYLQARVFTLIAFCVAGTFAILWPLIPHRDRFVAPGLVRRAAGGGEWRRHVGDTGIGL